MRGVAQGPLPSDAPVGLGPPLTPWDATLTNSPGFWCSGWATWYQSQGLEVETCGVWWAIISLFRVASLLRVRWALPHCRGLRNWGTTRGSASQDAPVGLKTPPLTPWDVALTNSSSFWCSCWINLVSEPRSRGRDSRSVVGCNMPCASRAHSHVSGSV